MEPKKLENTKLLETQTKVAEVVDIMKSNVNKVLDRGENIQNLQDKTEDLEAGAQRFHITAKKIKTKMLWQNRKYCICLAVVILTVIGIIVLATHPWST